MNRLAFAPLLVACSGGIADGKDAGGAGDASAVDARSEDAGDSGAVDAGLNGCSDFVDRSAPAADRTIVWAFDISPRCILVAEGQTVTWQGPLGYHPLDPFGGDVPSPMTTASSGSSASFVFPSAGDYGFHCRTHLAMQGVVRVRK
jgi:hypothetical protein